MLSEEMISRLVLEIKRFLLADAMLLSRASDEQLMRRIADVADHKLGKRQPVTPGKITGSAAGIQFHSGAWDPG